VVNLDLDRPHRDELAVACPRERALGVTAETAGEHAFKDIPLFS
jgi:hypothetical protein